MFTRVGLPRSLVCDAVCGGRVREGAIVIPSAASRHWGLRGLSHCLLLHWFICTEMCDRGQPAALHPLPCGGQFHKPCRCGMCSVDAGGDRGGADRSWRRLRHLGAEESPRQSRIRKTVLFGGGKTVNPPYEFFIVRICISLDTAARYGRWCTPLSG